MRIKSVPKRNAAAAIDAISNDSDHIGADPGSIAKVNVNGRILPIDLLPDVDKSNVELDPAPPGEQEDAQTECDSGVDDDCGSQVKPHPGIPVVDVVAPANPAVPVVPAVVPMVPVVRVDVPDDDVESDDSEPGYTHNPISLFLPHSPLPPETKKRKFKPGQKALREIKKYQKSTDTLLPKTTISNIVREIADRIYPEVRFQDKAIDAFHQAAEAYMQEIFEDAQLCAIHAGRVTIGVNDVLLANRIKNSGKK